MRLAFAIAATALIVSLYGHHTDNWRLTVLGGGFACAAVGTWLINIHDAWKDDDE